MCMKRKIVIGRNETLLCYSFFTFISRNNSEIKIALCYFNDMKNNDLSYSKCINTLFSYLNVTCFIC